METITNSAKGYTMNNYCLIYFFSCIYVVKVQLETSQDLTALQPAWIISGDSMFFFK